MGSNKSKIAPTQESTKVYVQPISQSATPSQTLTPLHASQTVTPHHASQTVTPPLPTSQTAPPSSTSQTMLLQSVTPEAGTVIPEAGSGMMTPEAGSVIPLHAQSSISSLRVEDVESRPVTPMPQGMASTVPLPQSGGYKKIITIRGMKMRYHY